MMEHQCQFQMCTMTSHLLPSRTSRFLVDAVDTHTPTLVYVQCLSLNVLINKHVHLYARQCNKPFNKAICKITHECDAEI